MAEQDNTPDGHGITDLKSELQLREWEQRYESYRAYTRQYLTGMSIAVTGYIIALSLSLGLQIEPFIKIIILSLLDACVFMLLIAHWAVYSGINTIGERLELLEKELGFNTFNTTLPVKRIVIVGAVVTMLALLVTLGLIIYIAGQPLNC
jgi:hypothetical protein